MKIATRSCSLKNKETWLKQGRADHASNGKD